LGSGAPCGHLTRVPTACGVTTVGTRGAQRARRERTPQPHLDRRHCTLGNARAELPTRRASGQRRSRLPVSSQPRVPLTGSGRPTPDPKCASLWSATRSAGHVEQTHVERVALGHNADDRTAGGPSIHSIVTNDKADDLHPMNEFGQHVRYRTLEGERLRQAHPRLFGSRAPCSPCSRQQRSRCSSRA
jgi:hypothetical protein